MEIPVEEGMSILPLSIAKKDNHTFIYCTAESCTTAWLLGYNDIRSMGQSVSSAILHANTYHMEGKP